MTWTNSVSHHWNLRGNIEILYFDDFRGRDPPGRGETGRDRRIALVVSNSAGVFAAELRPRWDLARPRGAVLFLV